MRIALQVLSVCGLLTVLPLAYANGGGAAPAPSMPMHEPTPQDKARDAYNDGVHEVKKADKAYEAAQQASDPGKKDKSAHDAHERYAKAHAKFQQAVQLDDSLHDAWNYLGYSSRKLGNYDEALSAYDRALSLKPGYADALEYRGEAYLGLNRVADAKQAYLDLYAGNRALAGKLLGAMKSWLAAQRAGASAPGGLDEFDKWIQERAQIAGQTASLTRAGAAAAWH